MVHNLHSLLSSRQFEKSKSEAAKVYRNSSSEEGSYLRLVDVCITLNSRPRVMMMKKKKTATALPLASGEGTTDMVFKTFALKIAQAKANIWP